MHGGWALTLIDSAAGCAAHTLIPAGGGYATIETKVNFSRPIFKDTGSVRAEGRVVARGRRIISCEARVVDLNGRLPAHGTSTVMALADEAGAVRPGEDRRCARARPVYSSDSIAFSSRKRISPSLPASEITKRTRLWLDVSA